MNKRAILNYLNCEKMDDKLETMIDECIKEVKDISYFKVISKEFPLSFHPLKINDIECQSNDLYHYLKDCEKVEVIACTLGIEIDKRIKYYQRIDVYKAYVFDAVCNHYLEYLCDEYEKTLNLGQHTFRICPGYGDIPLSLNQHFFSLIQAQKIGMYLYHDTFLPMKSMLGIIGIGHSTQKKCLSCQRKKDCLLRKEGKRCYVID